MASLGSVGEWHDTADVVVVGLGLAGAATAIHALELEPALDVLILEKMDEAQSGGNSRVSGQTLFLPRDSAKALGYQRALNATNPEPDVWLRAWAEEMVQLEPWVRRMAAEAGLRFNQTWADDPAPTWAWTARCHWVRPATPATGCGCCSAPVQRCAASPSTPR